MYLSNLIWIPKNQVNPHLKYKLQYTKINYDGSETEFEFYKETKDEIGIPRYYDKNLIYDDRTNFPKITWPDLHFSKGFDYRTGQLESINNLTNYLVNNYGGRLEAPTASGKTIISLAVASNLNTPTLVLVHKLDLLDQWKKLGDNTQPLYFPDLKVGFYYRNNTDYKDKHVVISTFQTIYSRLEEIPKDFFDSFGLVIVDESHIISAKTFTEVLSQFTARNILGVSATFRRKDKMEFVWDWYIGPLIHQHKTEKLVGKYYLKHIDTDLKTTGNAGIDGNIISKNYSRNKIILEDIISAAGSGRKILVLSDRTLHCEWFKEQLDKKGIDSKTYIGRNTKVEREEAKQSQVILATYKIFSEGVDVPTLDTLFILTPKTDIEQALGRIQRLAEKKEPLIVYYVDNSPKFISISKRLKRQLEELGFEDGFTRTKDN